MCTDVVLKPLNYPFNYVENKIYKHKHKPKHHRHLDIPTPQKP
jgi:hypothetical protein